MLAEDLLICHQVLSCVSARELVHEEYQHDQGPQCLHTYRIRLSQAS